MFVAVSAGQPPDSPATAREGTLRMRGLDTAPIGFRLTRHGTSRHSIGTPTDPQSRS